MDRIGYWLSEKKIKRFKFNEFVDACRNKGVELIEIDLNQPLESQGPFDVILHHINNLIGKVELGNLKAKDQIASFQNYLKNHPEIVVVNPLENVYKLLDRSVQYSFVKKCSANIPNSLFVIPPFVEFTTKDTEKNKRLMLQNDVRFPMVCKPSNSSAHRMQIIFCDEGLMDIEPPCVAQTFINHNAILYKVMVIDESVFVLDRPSIKNFASGPRPNIQFDSQDVSKASSSSYLNENDEVETPVVRPNMSELKDMAYNLKRHAGLDILGVDVIVESTTGKCFVIDINCFPGFDGVADFNGLLFELLLKCLEKSKQRPQTLTNSIS